MGFFDKIKAGLAKSRDALSNTLGSVFSGFSEIDSDFYDELEECLILADLGVETATKATERLRRAVKEKHLKTTVEAKDALKDILVEMLSVGDTALNLSTTPSVILVIGVNGVGKTTTIGKIAKQLVDQGKKVMLGIRSEDIVEAQSAPDEMTLQTTLEVREHMGSEILAYLDYQGNKIVAKVDSNKDAFLKTNKNLQITFKPENIHLFDKETEVSLREGSFN